MPPASGRAQQIGRRSEKNHRGTAAMRLAVLCALCLLPSGLALPLPREAGGTSEPQWKQAQDYLRRFYPSDPKTREADSFEARLKLMQRFFRLPVTGVLNPHTIEIMQKPRCGVPDVAEYSLFPTRPKWVSGVVTYRVVSYTPDLPRVRVNQLVAKALAMWSQEIPLSFRRVLVGTADIMIGFARGAHGDYYPFDGPGNTLAHAFAPGPGLGGDAHFDEDERWTDGSRRGSQPIAFTALQSGRLQTPQKTMEESSGVNNTKWRRC